MTPTFLNNRYRLIRTLGKGGFGETFLVEDTHLPSGRHCVLKQLTPVESNSQIYQLVKERFQREAAILEDLGEGSDGRIPRLYAYFSEADKFYLVQEYIEGDTLTQKVRNQGYMSEASVRETLTEILSILDYIHSKRMVHRDIKPDNIILRRNQKPVLIDFGAVKETMGTQINSQGNSTRSIIIGTPGFMPSEQAAGKPMYASDLYSLGFTAIYMLTGKMPQELETDPLTGETRWRQYAPNISPSLAAILDKSIRSYGGDRYQTAQQMRDAIISNVLTSPPTVATTIFSSSIPESIVSAPSAVSGDPISQLSQPPSTKTHSGSQERMNDWVKVVLMGSCMGGFVLAGLLITQQLQLGSNDESSDTPLPLLQSPTPQTLSSPPDSSSSLPPSQSSPALIPPSSTPFPSPLPSPTPSPINSQPTSSQPQAIGWIRLGAVANNSGYTSIGESLIATGQPVTIAPEFVPALGSRVTITTGANLRESFPIPPDYQLAEKVGELQSNQEIVILEIRTFVDAKSSSPHTIVWAKVGIQAQ